MIFALVVFEFEFVFESEFEFVFESEFESEFEFVFERQTVLYALFASRLWSLQALVWGGTPCHD